MKKYFHHIIGNFGNIDDRDIQKFLRMFTDISLKDLEKATILMI